jgi:hypothetical protein
MKIARSFSSLGIRSLRVRDDIRWRSPHPPSPGFKQNEIMTIMKVPELPILYTMIFAKP